MVREQLAGSDVRDRPLLESMGRVPRHEFVSYDQRACAYQDRPLPIGRGQTISQPYIVARMTQLLRPAQGFQRVTAGRHTRAVDCAEKARVCFIVTR